MAGSDCRNFVFVDETRTLVISRHGANILLNRAMVPEQEVSIRCMLTNVETNARIVGQVGEEPAGVHYGVEFLDPNVNVWGIEFPSLEESENAIGRVLMECSRCHYRQIIYLTEMEAEVFEANRSLTRICKRCGIQCLWDESLAAGPTEEEAPAAPPPRTENERQHVRVGLRITACIQHPQLGQEVISTEDVSRGGLRFKSRKTYAVGSIIDVALPYSDEGMNIFAPARIVHAKELPEEGVSQYGVQYIPAHKGWPVDLNIPIVEPKKARDVKNQD